VVVISSKTVVREEAMVAEVVALASEVDAEATATMTEMKKAVCTHQPSTTRILSLKMSSVENNSLVQTTKPMLTSMTPC